MDEQKNIRVIFTDKADSVFSDILKNNGLQETDEEFDKYLSQDKESKTMIVRDAVKVIAKKMIPEKKIVELLEKHLEIPKESIEKLVKEIKNKLLPLLLIYPEEKFNDSDFREEVSKKIFGNEEDSNIEKITPPYEKKIETTDVEKNAKKLGEERALEAMPTQERKKDKYREPID